MGQLDGVEKGYGAGFQMCEWVPPSLADRMEDIQQMMDEADESDGWHEWF